MDIIIVTFYNIFARLFRCAYMLLGLMISQSSRASRCAFLRDISQKHMIHSILCMYGYCTGTDTTMTAICLHTPLSIVFCLYVNTCIVFQVQMSQLPTSCVQVLVDSLSSDVQNNLQTPEDRRVIYSILELLISKRLPGK